MGAANKVSGKKMNKKVLGLVKMKLSLRRFYKKDFFPNICILNISRVVFNINCLFFAWLLISFVPMHFYYNRTFFRNVFVLNHAATRKKSQKIKSQYSRTLFPKNFYFKDFFPQDFFSVKIYNFISEIFFRELFRWFY